MRVLFLGAPGSGKGTQCKRLAQELLLSHLASGDLLREAISTGIASGAEAKLYMDKGILVPDPILIEMFREKLSSPVCSAGFILDGFPRNIAQAHSLDKLLSELALNLNVVINIKVDKELLTERIAGRRVCSNKTCQVPYHVKFAPPKKDNLCDLCGSELTTRSDDKIALIGERLKTYTEQTAPLIDYYSKLGLLKTLDGNANADSVYKQLIKLVQVPA